MIAKIHLTPLFRFTLRLILPLSLLVGTGCQVSRSAQASSSWKVYDAEWTMREDIRKEAAQYIGTRYKYAGTSPGSGFDCSGFTSYILAQYKIQLPHQSGAQANEGNAVQLSRLQPGDLVYFSRKGKIFHVALVEESDAYGITVIHSTSSRGVIRENISQSTYWKDKIAGARDVVRSNVTASR
ncbi:MAG: C40 family peptidase [Saprospiraceae bacterium]|nr:C40 family peptidase [Saprospiraceae bacterium]